MKEVPEEEAATNVAPSIDAILSTSNPALEITPLIPLVAATPVQTTIPSSPKPTTPSQETVTMAPMPEITLLASPVPTQFEEAVLINPEGSVMYATRQPEVRKSFLLHSSSTIKRQKAHVYLWNRRQRHLHFQSLSSRAWIKHFEGLKSSWRQLLIVVDKLL